jgi:hypothetical protein
LRIFKEAASKYAEPWRSAVQWLPDDTYISPDNIRYWADPIHWPTWNGKVTLAGDAAHPMMPFRAQGLNNAMQDSHNYVAGLVEVIEGRKTLSDAINEYSNESLDRGAKEIKLSAAWGPTLHDWNGLMSTPMMKQGYGKKEPEPESKPNGKVAEEEKKTEAAVVAEPETNGGTTTEKSVSPPEEEVQAVKSVESAPPKEPQVAVAVVPQTLTKLDVSAKNGPPTPPADSPTEPYSKLTTVVPNGTHSLPDENAFDSELVKLREENETLKKRNSVLVEKLKSIVSIISVEEAL